MDHSYLIFTILFVCLSFVLCQERPTIYDLTKGSKLEEFKKFHLTCVSSGNQPLFEWFLNGQKIVPNQNVHINNHDDTSVLTVKSMALEYSGEYKCEVSNRNGKDSRSILVDLNIKPRWKNEPIDSIAKLHSTISLKCQTVGTPKPITKWTKLTLEGDIERTFESDELTFNFTRKDVGMYRCTSENKLGKIEKTIQLKYYGLSKYIGYQGCLDHQGELNASVWNPQCGCVVRMINM